jgi:hypothetical protein
MSKKMYETCKHIKTNGTFCESPALDHDDYCYFHRADRERHKRAVRSRLRAERQPIQVPLLEDYDTIQVAIGDVLNELLHDRIDAKKAGLLLYGLQTAVLNIRNLTLDISFQEDDSVAEYTEHERITLEEEVAEIERAEAASTSPDVQVAESPTDTEEPDLNAPPKKKPAAAPVTQKEFWDVVGAMATQNAVAAADIVRTNLKKKG